jgi:hypothetical protein
MTLGKVENYLHAQNVTTVEDLQPREKFLKLANVIFHGKYYTPRVETICDFCNITITNSCYGYEDQDLCDKCRDLVAKELQKILILK